VKNITLVSFGHNSPSNFQYWWSKYEMWTTTDGRTTGEQVTKKAHMTFVQVNYKSIKIILIFLQKFKILNMHI